MPKKPKRPEAEILAKIERDAKMRLGCADLAPKPLRRPSPRSVATSISPGRGRPCRVPTPRCRKNTLPVRPLGAHH